MKPEARHIQVTVGRAYSYVKNMDGNFLNVKNCFKLPLNTINQAHSQLVVQLLHVILRGLKQF